MIKTVLSSLFAVFLFALGAVGAWYFVQFQQQQQQAAEAQAEASGLLLDSADVDLDSTSVTPTDHAQDRTTSSASAEPLPVAVQSRALSAEEIFRYGAVNRKNVAMIRQREQKLQQEEARLQLVKKDIQEQKTEIEGLLNQTQESIEHAQRLLQTLESARARLESEKQQFQQQVAANASSTQAVDGDQLANVKEIAARLGSIEPESAAKYLEKLYNDGDVDLVLQLFAGLEDRGAAKILEVLEPALAADLIKRYSEKPRPAQPQRRR